MAEPGESRACESHGSVAQVTSGTRWAGHKEPGCQRRSGQGAFSFRVRRVSQCLRSNLSLTTRVSISVLRPTLSLANTPRGL